MVAQIKGGVSDGTRTRDIRDHNAALYQLSYAHHVPQGRNPSGRSYNRGTLREFAGGGRVREPQVEIEGLKRSVFRTWPRLISLFRSLDQGWG